MIIITMAHVGALGQQRCSYIIGLFFLNIFLKLELIENKNQAQF